MDDIQAAEILLERRAARERFADYCRYITPEEPPSLHQEVICEYMDKVIEGEIRRLLIFAPPGSAKSTYSTKKFPAYFLGRFPKKAIICGSYDAELSTEFGRIVRNYVNDPKYGVLFDTRLSEDSRSKGQWATNYDGTYYACGVGSAVTGRRGDLGVIDDPVKGQEDADSATTREKTWKWYKSDFFSRLKPGAAQIIIQTRWNEDDLSGRILDGNWDGKSGVYKGFDGQDWHVLCFPAEAEEDDILGREVGEWLWPDYYTPEVWEEIKAVQTNKGTNFRVWNCLYQQNPQPDEGIVFKREMFEPYRYNLGEYPDVVKYGASDYAVTPMKGDYTEHGVGGYDKDFNLWIIDWWSGQTTPDIWIETQIDIAKKHRMCRWVSEAGVIRRAVGPSLEKRIRQRMRDGTGQFFHIDWLPHIGNKAANASTFLSLAASGSVHIPRCKWGDDLIDQLISFIPNANIRDDKVDVCGLLGRILNQAFAPGEITEVTEQIYDPYGFEEESLESWKVQ